MLSVPSVVNKTVSNPKQSKKKTGRPARRITFARGVKSITEQPEQRREGIYNGACALSGGPTLRLEPFIRLYFSSWPTPRGHPPGRRRPIGRFAETFVNSLSGTRLAS